MKGASRGRGVPPPCLIKDVTPCFFSSFPQVNDLSPSKFVLLWSRYPVPSAAPSGPRLEADALPPAGRATDSRGTEGGGGTHAHVPEESEGPSGSDALAPGSQSSPYLRAVTRGYAPALWAASCVRGSERLVSGVTLDALYDVPSFY